MKEKEREREKKNRLYIYMEFNIFKSLENLLKSLVFNPTIIRMVNKMGRAKYRNQSKRERKLEAVGVYQRVIQAFHYRSRLKAFPMHKWSNDIILRMKKR